MHVQRYISRRQALGVMGAGIASLALPKFGLLAHVEPALAASGSKLTPELTEGPYWVNTMLHRSDVRANTGSATTLPGAVQPGVPLLLAIRVLDASRGSSLLDGVAVDIWHANALGLYSDESVQQVGGGTTAQSTTGENFLRGYQITGEDPGIYRKATAGQVSFRTIWPGWYSGRAIHIHVRVRKLSGSGATIAGYTTQIFFSDADNNRVLSGVAPYNTRSPQRDPTTDEGDTVLQTSEIHDKRGPRAWHRHERLQNHLHHSSRCFRDDRDGQPGQTLQRRIRGPTTVGGRAPINRRVASGKSLSRTSLSPRVKWGFCWIVKVPWQRLEVHQPLRRGGMQAWSLHQDRSVTGDSATSVP